MKPSHILEAMTACFILFLAIVIFQSPADAYTVRHFTRAECIAIADGMQAVAKERDRGVPIEQQYKDIDSIIGEKNTVVRDKNDAEFFKELIRVVYGRINDNPGMIQKMVKASCYEANNILPDVVKEVRM